MVGGWNAAPGVAGLVALGALAARAAGEGLGAYYTGDDLVPLDGARGGARGAAAGRGVVLLQAAEQPGRG